MELLLTVILIASIVGVLRPYVSGAGRLHFAALALVAFLGMIFVQQMQMSPSIKDDVAWTTSSCEFEVHFPAKPQEMTREAVGLGTFQAAELVVGDAAFRSDCTAIPEKIARVVQEDPQAALRAILLDNAQKSGIEPVEIELAKGTGFVSGSARGSKIVNGSRVTYLVHAALGKHSLMSAVIGGPTISFPGPGQIAFSNSLRLRQDEMSN